MQFDYCVLLVWFTALLTKIGDIIVAKCLASSCVSCDIELHCYVGVITFFSVMFTAAKFLLFNLCYCDSFSDSTAHHFMCCKFGGNLPVLPKWAGAERKSIKTWDN